MAPNGNAEFGLRNENQEHQNFRTAESRKQHNKIDPTLDYGLF
jgi:hypothetical protein